MIFSHRFLLMLEVASEICGLQQDGQLQKGPVKLGLKGREHSRAPNPYCERPRGDASKHVCSYMYQGSKWNAEDSLASVNLNHAQSCVLKDSRSPP